MYMYVHVINAYMYMSISIILHTVMYMDNYV